MTRWDLLRVLENKKIPGGLDWAPGGALGRRSPILSGGVANVAEEESEQRH